MTKITYIPGEIANAAIDENGNRKPVTRTQHIFDDAKNKNQAEVNAEVDDTFAFHQSEINALNSQNYVTVDSFSSLPTTGAVDTIYRVSNWDGTQQDPTVYSEYAWNGSQYIHLNTKTQIGEVFDISAYHATGGTLATYDDLSAALTSNNGGVPQSIRKGGMSVKFVQSSDNKYVQYRLMADEFITDTTQWAIADEGVYVENPEFVKVELDRDGRILEAIKKDGTKLLGAGAEIEGDVMLKGKAEITSIENPEFAAVWLDDNDHILYGVQKDGDFYFGYGVPRQIVEYVEGRIEDLSLDEYEDIVAFLNGLETGDKTLAELLNEKVDKEEGKSLIDAEYAASQSVIDSPEFLDVTLDVEDKVLEGIQQDGTKVIGGDLSVGGSANINGNTKILGNMEVSGVSYKVIENLEYLAAWVDAEDKVIFGLKADGKTYIGDADFLNDIEDIKAFIQNVTDKNIDWDALSSITTVENPEYIEAKTDSEGKVLAGRTNNGAAFENVGFSTPKVSIDGHTIKNIEDTEERSEITTDSEDKIISYRDADGVKHENVGIESESIKTNSLNLTPDGMTEFQQALKDAGFQPGGAGNFSDSAFVELPIPTVCTDVNIIPDSDVPITNVPIDGYLEYYDHLGNYFKKRISGFDIQGDSSKAMPYKNYKFDLDDDSKIKFGNWVPQDSFHLKKYYMDNFRGQCVVGYWLAEQMYQCREFENRKPYEYLYKNTSFINGNGSIKEDFYTGALCHPDGFPIKLYYNGTLLGVYTFNLKKDKDNYAMKKTTTSHIILDGELYISNIWGGTVNWSAFEIRNPKPKKKKDGWELVDINGDTYDGDNPKELMGTTTPGYDSTNTSHKKSANTKAAIERLAGAINAVNAASTTSEKKEVFETYFKVDECIDYFLFANMVYDNDGLGKNWIWCTWDGLIWSPTYYDKDSIFGLIPATGLGITENSTTAILESNNTSDPIGLVYNLYRDEVIARYNELKENNVFTKENIIGLLETWVSRIGYDNLKEELEESCPETPSYRSNNLYDGWLITGLENKSLPAFDSNHTYVEGERCWFLNMSLLAMKTIEPHDSPIENPYSLYPYGGGFYNSIQRVYNWLSARFITLDNVIS